MNTKLLARAEKEFLAKYPGGFSHPAMAAIAKKHRIEQLSAEITRLDAALASPDRYADAPKAQRLAIERGQIAKRLADAEEVWLSATSAYEEAEKEDIGAP